MPNSLLNEEQYALIGRIAVAATELELEILQLAKRVSKSAELDYVHIFSNRQRLLKTCESGLDELAKTQVNPEAFLQREHHFMRVRAALDSRDAFVHGVFHLGEGGVTAVFHARANRSVRASISELCYVLDEIKITTGHTALISHTLDSNFGEELLANLRNA